MSDTGQPSSRRWLTILINVIACAAIIAGTAAGIQWIYRTQPTAQKDDFKRKSAALVETIRVERKTWSPNLTVLGTVQPAQDIVLSPRVRGQVLEISDDFVPGGMVRKGQMLLQVDPADFQNSVSIRKSELEQVDALWKIEQGRQSLAKQELELLGDSIDSINEALVLREPQAASLQSQLKAAQAAVERAELDLERTRLIAPFDAQVLRADVNVGSQVQPGDDLGQLVGVDQYWVMAAVPVRNLRWVKFATQDQPGSQVTLYDSESWGPGVSRQGQVARMIGSLDQQTRLARVLVTVDDPLGQNSDVPPLILDTLIDVSIQGTAIPDVVRIPRNHVRNRDTVWVMVDGKLEIRDTDIVFQDPEYAYIRTGLEDGDEVVTTTLATVANGVLLKKINATEAAMPAAEAEEQANSSPKRSSTTDGDATRTVTP